MLYARVLRLPSKGTFTVGNLYLVLQSIHHTTGDSYYIVKDDNDESADLWGGVVEIIKGDEYVLSN
jgi:hypothetical protein